MLKEKYSELLTLGSTLNLKELAVTEEQGKLRIKGVAPFQKEKDLFWDKIKGYQGWDNEIAADIKVEKSDIYGTYKVQPGDSLSRLAKSHLGDAGRYMEIFKLNQDVIQNPDMIKVGQTLRLPAR